MSSLSVELPVKFSFPILEDSEIIFKTKKMNVFLEWEWDVTNEVCAICRNEMVDSCMRKEVFKWLSSAISGTNLVLICITVLVNAGKFKFCSIACFVGVTRPL